MKNNVLLHKGITLIVVFFVIITFAQVISWNAGKMCDSTNAKKIIVGGSLSTLQTNISDRILMIDVNYASDNDYDAAIELALSCGMQATSLSLQWDQIEVSPYEYQDPYGYLEISNVYYPAFNISLALMIGPIDTVANRMPKDLQGKAFDDPEVVTRYQQMIDFVFSKIPDVHLVSFSIGNEVDVYLNSENKWDEYTEFFRQTKQHVNNLVPYVPVGVKATFGGHTQSAQSELENLNQYSDAVFVTYYPLKANFHVKDPSVIPSDFNQIVSLYPQKEIYLLEAGYPSGFEIIESSEEKQSEFITQVFESWDTYSSQIRLINFVWLHDISEETLEEYRQYYGSSNPGFLEYLATLGIRHYEGAAKSAYMTLKKLGNPEKRPNKPLRPLGPTSGKIGNEYIYNTSTTDPDGNQIFYKWDWGDKTFSDWLGPYDSGETISVIHTWQDVGNYDVRVYAKNINDIESEWSDLLPVGMPKNKAVNINPLFLRFLEQHPSMLPILRYLLRLQNTPRGTPQFGR